MKTYSPKPREIHQEWFVVDATGKTLGRLATTIAETLRGKHKPQYAPHVDTGDYVVVVNCDKVAVTGAKLAIGLHRRRCPAAANRETADGRSGLLGGSPLGRSCTPADIGTVPGVYSLPTADQWDYACLGTRQSGVEAAQLDRYGWTLENSGGAVHEVGLKKPNRLGLHDMHGNVQELCFGDSRGGGWSTPATASTAERMGGYGNHAGPGSDVGFRVIVELP